MTASHRAGATSPNAGHISTPDGAPPRVETAALTALRTTGVIPPSSPIYGASSTAPGGARLREVTFVWTPPAGAVPAEPLDVMVHINSVTDAHRTDIGPALLEWIPQAGCAALGCLLPEGLVASYRFVADAHLPPDAGRDRPSWKRIHELGRPDPRNVERLTNPLGGDSSVMRLPGSPRHPAEEGAARSTSRRPIVSLPPQEGGDVSVTVLPPEEDPRAVLILFDAEFWQRLDAARLFAHYRPKDLLVMMIGSGSLAHRGAFLPAPTRVSGALRPALRDARGAGLIPATVGPDQVVVAGQSYGGLAAGGIVVDAPDVATNAILQSGSFWYRAADDGRGSAAEIGDLVAALPDRDLSGRRIVVQFGSQEQDLGVVGRAFSRAASASGADVRDEVFVGGHDYACWRTALLYALDALALPRGSQN